jgi:hypothetical protein
VSWHPQSTPSLRHCSQTRVSPPMLRFSTLPLTNHLQHHPRAHRHGFLLLPPDLGFTATTLGFHVLSLTFVDSSWMHHPLPTLDSGQTLIQHPLRICHHPPKDYRQASSSAKTQFLQSIFAYKNKPL